MKVLYFYRLFICDFDRRSRETIKILFYKLSRDFVIDFKYFLKQLFLILYSVSYHNEFDRSRRLCTKMGRGSHRNFSRKSLVSYEISSKYTTLGLEVKINFKLKLSWTARKQSIPFVNMINVMMPFSTAARTRPTPYP